MAMTRMARVTVSACVAIGLGGAATAQDESEPWKYLTPEYLRHPELVEGVAHRDYVSDEYLDGRVTFAIAWDWTRCLLERKHGSFGWVMQSFARGDLEASWRYEPGENRVLYTDTFARVGDIASEMKMGLLPVLRVLSRQDHGQFEMVEQGAERVVVGVTGYRGLLQGRTLFEVDTVNRKLLSYRNERDGELTEATEFLDWIELSDGRHAPTVIVDNMSRQAGSRSRTTIEYVDPPTATKSTDAFEIAPDAMVYDFIDEVTRKPDWSEIGPMRMTSAEKHGAVNGGVFSARNAFIAGGVAMVVFAGIVWRSRGHAA